MHLYVRGHKGCLYQLLRQHSEHGVTATTFPSGPDVFEQEMFLHVCMWMSMIQWRDFGIACVDLRNSAIGLIYHDKYYPLVNGLVHVYTIVCDHSIYCIRYPRYQLEHTYP